MKKICKDCNKEKEFYGRGTYCKSCHKIRMLKYYRSVNGLVSVIYSLQKRHSKLRGHRPPDYNKQWLHDRIVSDPNFKFLYADWVDSGYLKNLKPSIDRLDDDLPYTESNIILTTWGENHKRKVTKDSKPIKSVNILSGDTLHHKSIKDASRRLGIRDVLISHAINHNEGNFENFKFTLHGKI